MESNGSLRSGDFCREFQSSQGPFAVTWCSDLLTAYVPPSYNFLRNLPARNQCSTVDAHAYFLTEPHSVCCTPAIACAQWPESAEGFFARERQWPPEDVVCDVRLTKVLVVPRGGESQTWTYCFAPAETVLLTSLSEEQLTAYLVVTSLMARIKLPAAISMAVFLAVMETDDSKSMTSLVLSFFSRLRTGLLEGKIVHYFIETENLVTFYHIESPDQIIAYVDRVSRAPFKTYMKGIDDFHSNTEHTRSLTSYIEQHLGEVWRHVKL